MSCVPASPQSCTLWHCLQPVSLPRASSRLQIFKIKTTKKKFDWFHYRHITAVSVTLSSWRLQQPSPRMLHSSQTTAYSEAAPWSHCSASGCRSGSRSSTRNDVKCTSEGSFFRNPDKAADERVCEKGLAAGINTSAIYLS